MRFFIFVTMIFCHIIDDYKLQSPVRTQLKQRAWWEKHEPNERYKHDYIMALAMHALSWSFMIHVPIAVYYRFELPFAFVITFITNAIIHAIVDDMKANKLRINLITDQSIHVVQILLTAIVFLGSNEPLISIAKMAVGGAIGIAAITAKIIISKLFMLNEELKNNKDKE